MRLKGEGPSLIGHACAGGTFYELRLTANEVEEFLEWDGWKSHSRREVNCFPGRPATHRLTARCFHFLLSSARVPGYSIESPYASDHFFFPFLFSQLRLYRYLDVGVDP